MPEQPEPTVNDQAHPSGSPAEGLTAPGPRYAPPPGGYPPPQYSPHPSYAQYPPQTPPGYPPHPHTVSAQPLPPGYPPYGVPYGYAFPSGRRFWAMGFLSYIPYVGMFVALIVILVMRSGAKGAPHPVIRENARWAANWILTAFAGLTLGFALMIGSAIAGAVTEDMGGDGDVWLPSAMVGILIFCAVAIAHLIVIIMGTVVADRRVFHPGIAIPFFRAPR
ncbi:hypothetical protein [Leucobacter sp. GX24907]